MNEAVAADLAVSTGLPIAIIGNNKIAHTEAYKWDNEKFVNSSQMAPSSRSPQRN